MFKFGRWLKVCSGAKNKNNKNIFLKICTVQKNVVNLHTSNESNDTGEMAEWSIAAVLKTVEGHTSGGSNPSLSAINAENQQITK